jgi:dTDP-4-dehydrorhamnose 3,5-epimerase
MIFTETPLPGAFVIDVQRFEDERGFFAEGWKDTEAAQHGIDVMFNRSNISYNRHAGTIRGLHAQREPFAEAKLVRCPRGAILDVIVDIRPDSPTYLQWTGVELTAENRRMMYVPTGFLHGFQTLTDDTEVFYQVCGSYRPDMEIGARYDDPALNITWPLQSEPILSPKDRGWPDWKALSLNNYPSG